MPYLSDGLKLGGAVSVINVDIFDLGFFQNGLKEGGNQLSIFSLEFSWAFLFLQAEGDVDEPMSTGGKQVHQWHHVK